MLVHLYEIDVWLNPQYTGNSNPLVSYRFWKPKGKQLACKETNNEKNSNCWIITKIKTNFYWFSCRISSQEPTKESTHQMQKRKQQKCHWPNMVGNSCVFEVGLYTKEVHETLMERVNEWTSTFKMSPVSNNDVIVWEARRSVFHISSCYCQPPLRFASIMRHFHLI